MTNNGFYAYMFNNYFCYLKIPYIEEICNIVTRKCQQPRIPSANKEDSSSIPWVFPNAGSGLWTTLKNHGCTAIPGSNYPHKLSEQPLTCGSGGSGKSPTTKIKNYSPPRPSLSTQTGLMKMPARQTHPAASASS